MIKLAERQARRHELNNIFCKILGAAELALDLPCTDEVRNELETIMRLAEEGGATFRPSRRAEFGG